MGAINRHKHLLLLVVALVGLVLQPVTHRVTFGTALYELLAYLLLMAVFLVVFERRGQRWTAFALGVPGIIANAIGHLSTGTTSLYAVLVYHGLVVLFLGFAVGVVLRGVFRSHRIGADEIFGAFSGYVLAGVAWGNLYVMIQVSVPESFNVAPGLAWQLQFIESRRFLFNYFSFATLTTVGYGDVTPLAPAACALAWLEAMFGQFYMAVFIGQLIGMKLSEPRPSVHAK